MKRILIVHHGWGYGGALIALLRLIRKLKVKYKIEVLCLFDSCAVKYIRDEKVQVHIAQDFFYQNIYKLFIHSEASYNTVFSLILKFYSFCTYLVNMFFYAKKELSKYEYDILYLNSLFLTDWLYTSTKHKKVIMHIREPLKDNSSLYTYIIRNRIKKYVSKIIAVSKDNANRLGSTGVNTTVIYDPVIKPIEIKYDISKLRQSSANFVYLGGSQRIKGFEILVNSLPYLNKNIKIFFLGNNVINKNSLKSYIRFLFSSYARREQKLSNILRNSPHIIYVGEVKDIWSYYAKSIALISPFAKPHASLPILEAQSIGLPVITSNVSGAEELVKNEYNGYIFSSNNAMDLANKINLVYLLQEEDIDTLSKNSKSFYLKLRESEFDIFQVIEND